MRRVIVTAIAAVFMVIIVGIILSFVSKHLKTDEGIEIINLEAARHQGLVIVSWETDDEYF